MKRVLLGIVVAAAASLVGPLSASAAEYSAFVGCDDLSSNPVPSHVCQVGDFPAAYFESDEETEYEVCVEFPQGAFLCAEEQEAEAGVLYLNSITSETPGLHTVWWYVEGVEVASWAFRLDPPPPPPAAPVVTPPVITPAPAVAPPVNSACLKAEKHVGKLKGQLKQASGHSKKVKLRSKLKAARAAARAAC
jgi:hypothetical protein